MPTEEEILKQASVMIPADIEAPGALQEFIVCLRQMAMTMPPFTSARANMLHLAILAEKDDNVARKIWANTVKGAKKDPSTQRVSMPKTTQ